MSRFDPNGLTAVSLAAPFQMLMIALSTGMGTGINSLISRRLGEKRSSDARRASWNGLLIEVAGSMLFILLGLFLAGPLMNLVTGNIEDHRNIILQMGTDYLSIVTVWSTGLFVAIYFERLLQSTGNTMASMITQLCGALTNIILDPILIYGKLGLEPMGVSGAAIATVVGQWVSAVVGFVLNQIKNEELKLSLKDFSINMRDIRGIVAVGLPSSVMASIGSVMYVGMNAILSGFPQNNAGINVFSIYFKLQSFVFMPVFGLANGIIAIIAYNFGARLKDRVYECIRTALVWAGTIMVIGTAIFLIFPGQLMSIFESESDAELSAQMSQIGGVAMRIISIHFILAAVGITLSTVFQAVGKGIYSLIMSVCRQLVLLLPAAWILARIADIYVVWWCFPIAEIGSLFICLFFYRKCSREMLSKLEPSVVPAGMKPEKD